MVTVRQALSLEEEVVGLLLVELGTSLVAETMVGDVEVGIFSLLEPVGPLCALKTVSWPIPGVLGLNNIELAIKAESHHVVSNSRASTIHDHWVQTIKSHNSEEVT